MKFCVVFLLTMLAMLIIIVSSWADSVYGSNKPQETNNGSALLKIGESLSYVSKDPDESFDLRSAAEKSIHQTTSDQSSEIVTPPDSALSQRHWKFLALILATGLNERPTALAETEEEAVNIDVHTGNLLQGTKESRGTNEALRNKTRLSYGQTEMQRKTRPDADYNPSSKETKNRDNTAHDSTQSLDHQEATIDKDSSSSLALNPSFQKIKIPRNSVPVWSRTFGRQGVAVEQDSRSNSPHGPTTQEMKIRYNTVSEPTETLDQHGATTEDYSRSSLTRNASYQRANSQDGIGHDSSKRQGSKIEQDVSSDSRHRPFSHTTKFQDSAPSEHNTNSNLNDVIISRLPKMLKTRNAAITNNYDLKLLQEYIDASTKLPIHAHRNLQNYYLSYMMDKRITLKSLVAKAKNETAQLIADYKALRNGYDWDQVKLNPNLKSILEKVSAAWTAFENLSSAELKSLDDFLGDSSSSKNGEVDEESTVEDTLKDVRTEDLEKAGPGARGPKQRLTTEGVWDGKKAHEDVVKLVKRDAAKEEPAVEDRAGDVTTAADIGMTATGDDKSSTSSASSLTGTEHNISGNSTETKAKKGLGGVVIPFIIIAISIVELIVATLVIFKDKIFAKKKTDAKSGK